MISGSDRTTRYHRLRAAAGCALLLAGATAVRAQQPAGAAASGPETEIVVEGRHEGPRMWTVRKGDHTLWILGTISPLPKNMVWQPDAVQEVLRHAQEVVPAWPAYGIGANPLTALRVYIEWRRLQKPPDHMPLRQALPPPLYARVAALEARFDPNDSKLEQMRPMLAARQLLTRVFDASGLAQGHVIRRLLQAPPLDVHAQRGEGVGADAVGGPGRHYLLRVPQDLLHGIGLPDHSLRQRGDRAQDPQRVIALAHCPHARALMPSLDHDFRLGPRRARGRSAGGLLGVHRRGARQQQRACGCGAQLSRWWAVAGVRSHCSGRTRG